jgi:tetratricopeptide (TPR) repeat protein
MGRRFSGFLVRHGLTVIACAPAVLVAAAVVGLAGLHAMRDRSSLLNTYRREAASAAQAKDLRQLVLCLERACVLDPNEASIRFELARALAASEEHARASVFLTQLAPLDRRGYAPAQVWVASSLLVGNDVSSAQIQDAEAHLLRALESDPNLDEANLLLGRLYAQTGKLGKAVPLLMRAAPNHPEVLLLLADAHATLSLPNDAKKWAAEALKESERRSEADPDNEEARLRTAAARFRLNDHAVAVRVLQEGLARRESIRLRRALGDIYAAWIDNAEKERPDALADRMTLLELGLRQCPAHPSLLDRMARLLRHGGPEAESAKAHLEELLTDGKAAPLAHFLLGNDAYRRGKTDEARVHYEQASRLAPEAPVLANNLAWFLAEGPEADPERALTLVDVALAKVPNDLRFRSTRGHVLVRMKRWQEALVDLEAALPLEAGLPDLHLDLAATYEGLGLTDLAKSHRRRAEAKTSGTSGNDQSPGPPKGPL